MPHAGPPLKPIDIKSIFGFVRQIIYNYHVHF